MKNKSIIIGMVFSVLFLGSLSFYALNNNKIKYTKIETNCLKTEFQSLKIQNETLRKINYQLLQTNAEVDDKVNKLNIISN